MSEQFANTGLRWIWLSIILLVADQATKTAIVDSMQLYQSISLFPGLNFTYVHNYGAAFSFLSDQGGWQRWFFTTIAVVVSGLLVVWMWKTPKQQNLVAIAFALILSGAIGNVYDRIVHGYVIDFIDVYYQSWHFPAFNIADSAICIGAALMIWDAVFGEEEAESND